MPGSLRRSKLLQSSSARLVSREILESLPFIDCFIWNHQDIKVAVNCVFCDIMCWTDSSLSHAKRVSCAARGLVAQLGCQPSHLVTPGSCSLTIFPSSFQSLIAKNLTHACPNLQVDSPMLMTPILDHSSPHTWAGQPISVPMSTVADLVCLTFLAADAANIDSSCIELGVVFDSEPMTEAKSFHSFFISPQSCPVS